MLLNLALMLLRELNISRPILFYNKKGIIKLFPFKKLLRS